MISQESKCKIFTSVSEALSKVVAYTGGLNAE